MRSPTATEKLTAITLGLVAVISPLYVDRRAVIHEEEEEDDNGLFSAAWLPLVLILLIVVAINITCFLDHRFMRFDPYWIHRVGGSSAGIVALLVLLGFVLNCKSEVFSL